MHQYSAPASGSKADAAFVLGIISIFLNVLYVPGILAIIWGGRERQENSKARTGFICGIIGTALSALWTLLIIVAIASPSNAVNDAPSTPAPAITVVPAPAAVTPSSPAPTVVTPSSPAPTTPAPTTPVTVPDTASVITYYANCSAAKAAGAAPLNTGDPGYRSALDRDGDGVACES